MAIEGISSLSELGRIYEELYANRTYNVILCMVGQELSTSAPLSEYRNYELSFAGYAEYSFVSNQIYEYDYETGEIIIFDTKAEFQGHTSYLTFDTLVVYQAGQDYPVSVEYFPPAYALYENQTNVYNIKLRIKHLRYPGRAGGSLDIYWKYVRFFLTFEEDFVSGTDSGYNGMSLIGSTNFTSNSYVSTKRSKFYSRSLELTPNGDEGGAAITLGIPLSLDSSDFTVECFVYFIPKFEYSTIAIVASQDATSSSIGTAWELYIKKVNNVSVVNFKFIDSNGAPTVWEWSASTDPFVFVPGKQWCHLAMSRSGRDFRIFIDGQVALARQFDLSTTQIVDSLTGKLQIGGRRGASFFTFNGHIDEYRMTIGVSRYDSSFSPPILPFYIGKTWEPAPIDLRPPETPLFLLSFNSTPLASRSFYDCEVITNGTVSISSVAPSKFSQYAVLESGNNEFVTITNLEKAPQDFDWSFDCWYYPLSTQSASFPVLFSIGNPTFNHIELAINWSSKSVYLVVRNGFGDRNGEVYTASNIVIVNTWMHVAIQRRLGEYALWINGQPAPNYFLDPTSFFYFQADELYRIGGYSFNNAPFNGRIDEARMVPYAPYVKDSPFSVPTAPYFI